MTVHHRDVAVGDVRVHYRESGSRSNPSLVLLHGFPTSSHMFRDVIPLLAPHFHVVAPDLPGFGLTTVPRSFTFTFDALADVTRRFLAAIDVPSYALYVFDYGAPVGFRIAASAPGRVTAIVTQNGNAYDEGLSEAWSPIRTYWEDPSPEHRDALRILLTAETTTWQYVTGVADTTCLDPDAWRLDQLALDRAGNADAQLDLFADYRTNVERYPEFQRYLREHRPPLLAVWGRHDPFFVPAGAEAFRRDVPDAEIRFYDTGHFALASHGAEIAAAIIDFLGRRGRGVAPQSVVESFYRYIEDGKPDAAIALLAPDISWTGTEGFPYAGVYGSPDEVLRGVLEPIARDWGAFAIAPERYVVAGDEVIAVGWYSGTTRAGTPARARFTHLWRVRDGNIVRMLQISDTAPLRDALAVGVR